MKLTTKQNWFLTLLAIALLSVLPAMAQVKIGDQVPPNDFSILELVSGGNKGLRLPQIANTSQRDSQITNSPGFKSSEPAKGLQIYNLETKQVETWDGTRWIGDNEDKAIWLPSTNFPWNTTIGTTIQVDLFEVYKKAFTDYGNYGPGDRYINSTFPSQKINVPGYKGVIDTDFYYVITDYDDSAIENLSVTEHGIFSYKTKKINSENAWVNILLVRK